MGISLKGKNFIDLADFTPVEIRYLLDMAHQLKAEKRSGIDQKRFVGKNAVMMFELGSTRTRCSFETAAWDLGMGMTYLSNSHCGVRETIKDTIRVLSRIYDAIIYRGPVHADLIEMSKYASVPLINALTDDGQHPTQMLADFMTLEEEWGHNSLKGKRVCYIGNGQCCAYSYAVFCALVGADFVLIGPDDCRLKEHERTIIKDMFKKYNPTGKFIESSNPNDVKGCHVITCENWGSFCETDFARTWAPAIDKFRPYQVNAGLLKMTGVDDVIVMHMLPASHNCEHALGKQLLEVADPKYREFIKNGFELTDDVFEENEEIIFREAENRQHTIKAVLNAFVG